MPKALILYTAHTIGHKKIAENIGYWLSEIGWQVEMRDALNLAGDNKSVKGFLRLHTLIYKYAPFIWKWLYDWGYIFLMLPFRPLVARKFVPAFLKLLDDERPDLVITTQISPSSVLAEIKKKKLWSGKWAIVFSDYHFHPSWALPGADGYLTNIEEQREFLVKRGVPKAVISVGGLWLPPRLNSSPIDARKKLGLDTNTSVILVGVGSGGWVNFDVLLKALQRSIILGAEKKLRTIPIILCGKNTWLLKKLRSSAPSEWIILGFRENLQELYSISDVFLTKPGGLSIAEALQWHLPCFVPFLLPGQENKNLHYLKTKQLAVSLKNLSPSEWPKLIINELLTKQFRLDLQKNKFRDEIANTNLAGKLSTWLHGLFHIPNRDV